MKTLSQIVEEEEVMRRNKLRTHCTKQIEASIRDIEAELSSIVFLSILFCYTLERCRRIVKLVKNNVSFLEAEILTEEREDDKSFRAIYFTTGTNEPAKNLFIRSKDRSSASKVFEAMMPKCVLVSLKELK